MRKADYYTIALSTATLRSAAVGRLPPLASMVITALVPWKPTWVTAGNIITVEVNHLLSVLVLHGLHDIDCSCRPTIVAILGEEV